MTVKYLGTYSGPSYGSLDATHVDAFESLYDAMRAMQRRQGGSDDVVTYTEDHEGVYRLEGREEYQGHTLFPATTRDDVLWLYWALPYMDGYIMGDLAYCVTVGPRGGIRSEKA